MKDEFVDVKLTKSNLDRFVIRRSIFKSLKENIQLLSGSLLDVGCGKMPYKNYILENSKVTEYTGLDIDSALIYDNLIKPDYTWDGKVMPLESNSFDCVLATEVLEHCPNPELVLNEVIRVLKPGGIFYFTVPFLWNLHEVPHDEYRYTPFSLQRHLMNSGFKEIGMKATGGWHASMAQMLGLWVRRSEMPERKRNILSYILKPVIKYLVKIDKTAEVRFINGQMITGISGFAKKGNTTQIDHSA